MFLYSLFYGWELHIVAKEVAQIGISLLRQQDGGILEREFLALAEPFLRENLLIVVGTCIHQYVLRLIEVIPVTHLVHLLDEAVAHLAAAEEGERLDGKAAPGFLVQEQGDVLKESIVGGYGIQTVDGLRVFAIQRLCRFQVIVGGIKRKDIYVKTDDAGTLLLLDKGGFAVHEFGEIQRV